MTGCASTKPVECNADYEAEWDDPLSHRDAAIVEPKDSALNPLEHRQNKD
jgi:hypothetical protein